MKKVISLVLIISMLFTMFVINIVPTSAVSDVNSFTIVSAGMVPDILVENSDYKQVVRVASDLQKDIKAVSAIAPVIKNTTSSLSQTAIIIGTIGKSSTISKLMQDGKLDEAKGIQGKWESYVIKKVSNPLPGVTEALVVAGSNMRGTIYGAYDISEQIGVSPWYWWADVKPTVKSEILISSQTKVEGEPSVKYRGVFINDETNFTNWSKQFKSTVSSSFPNEITYGRLFELMLRLKANTVWPAMHPVSAAFNKDKDANGIPINAKTADQYGIVMGTSHCEMILRNNEGEWDDWVKKNAGKYELPASLSTSTSSNIRTYYDFSIAPKALEAYWRERIQTNGDFENLYTIGMRGVHDTGMAYAGLKDQSMASRVNLLNQVIKLQRNLIKEKYGSETGAQQVFIPYKEAADYYNNGLSVPDDATLMWAEDNFGYVRQVPTLAENKRAGGSGVYYHISYYGAPNSYIWIDSTPLITMYEELKKSYDTGASRYWILNVGDLKPGEIGTDFFMKFAWNVGKINDTNIKDYLASLAKRDFEADDSTAREISSIITEYFQQAHAKRAENMGLEGTVSEPFSLINYGDEAQLRVEKMNELFNRAQAVYSKLTANRKNAFYEMVYYPIRSTKYSLDMVTYAMKNQLYAKQGRYKSVSDYMDLARKAQDNIVADYKNYQGLENGKWINMINPYPNGYPQPLTRAKLDAMLVSKGTAIDGIGSVCEGQDTYQDDVTLKFSSLENNKRFIDIFGKGEKTYNWTSTTSDSFIKLSKTSGSVVNEERIIVTIDWSKLGNNETKSGTITIKDDYKNIYTFKISAKKSGVSLQSNSYAEANGVVAIEAENYTEAIAGKDGTSWKVLEGMGRNGSSMRVYPDNFHTRVDSNFDQTAQLKYKVYFESTGTFTGKLYRIPTLNEGSENGVVRTARTAVGIDNTPPTVLGGSNKSGSGNWSKNVMENIEKLTFTVKVTQPGYHDIVVYKSDAGIVFDRIVINTGGEQKSYMGPPTSYNTMNFTTQEVADSPLSTGAKPTSTSTATSTTKPTPTPTSTTNPNPDSNLDINRDGVINMADVIVLASKFNKVTNNPEYTIACDLNKDGAINMADVIMIAAKFGKVI
ncbi:MAG: glycosyl hydrolase 115 family protein [Bacillota bacterium]|nr:glycosyl hydrolase 115 family protein [Bacillota bacterium]